MELGMATDEKRDMEHTRIAIDEYLQELVNIITGTEIEFPVTIYINGAILSGYLTSGHNYFEGIKEQYRIYFQSISDDSESIDKILDELTSLKQNYLVDAETKYSLPLPIYIHMRDAKCFTPGQKPMTDEGQWWRGKLSSVDGFHLGRLEPVSQ